MKDLAQSGSSRDQNNWDQHAEHRRRLPAPEHLESHEVSTEAGDCRIDFGYAIDYFVLRYRMK